MKILVTGSAGFIGFHLINKLVSEGFEVVGLDNINDYYDPKLKLDRLNEVGIKVRKDNELIQSTKYENYKFLKLNLENFDAVKELFENEKFDYVCNLAAQAGVRYSLENPRSYINSNLIGFFNILELSQQFKIKHLIYASSSSVYGLNTKVPFSEHHSADHQTSLYAASKKANEMMAHSYSHIHNLPTTGLRFFTVYGPWGRPDMALFKFTKSILEGKEIEVYGHGKMLRDFTYIDDIVEGVFRLINKFPVEDKNWDSVNADSATSSAPFRIFNIGKGSPVNLLDFINILEKELGIEAKKKFVDMQPGEVYQTFADTTDLENEIDYKAGVSIEEGVREFVKWYKRYY